MRNVENNFIDGGIKNIVQGNRCFDHTQVGADMTAGFADFCNKTPRTSSASAGSSFTDSFFKSEGELI